MELTTPEPATSSIVVTQLPKDIATERASLVERLLTLGPIRTAEDREVCGAGLTSVRGVLDRVRGHYTKIKSGIDGLKKMVLGMESGDVVDLVKVDEHLSSLITTWDVAEAERIERENEARERAAQEEAKRNAEVVAADLRAAATEAKKAGQADVAVALREQARDVRSSPPIAPFTVAKRQTSSGGIATQFTWEAECVDIRALARAVVAGKVPVEAIAASASWLKKRADADRTTFNVPGCVARKVPSTKRTPARR